MPKAVRINENTTQAELYAEPGRMQAEIARLSREVGALKKPSRAAAAKKQG